MYSLSANWMQKVEEHLKILEYLNISKIQFKKNEKKDISTYVQWYQWSAKAFLENWYLNDRGEFLNAS